MSTYWERRKGLKYYDRVQELVHLHCKGGGSLLDVGSGDTEFYMRFFPHFYPIVLVDKKKRTPTQYAKVIQEDFMKLEPENTYDVVICLQVLEHVSYPWLFMDKLFSITKDLLIVSVPYMWKKGQCKEHTHDPIDKGKLIQWASATVPFIREPIHMEIVKERTLRRLIGVWRMS